MSYNKILGKRTILSLIVIILLSLVIGSVIVYSIDENKIKLDELAKIKKLVLAERDKTFNAVKEKIDGLLSDTKDGEKKSADEIKADKEEAQKLIDALSEVEFLTDEQKTIVTGLNTGITPAPGSPQAGADEKESPWGKGKWRLWTSIPLALALIYMLLRKGRYKSAGKGVGVGWKWLWLRISGKKGEQDAIDRYNKKLNELNNKIKEVIAKDILGHLKEKEELIIANFKAASLLVSLGNLIRNSLFKKGSPFVKSHALDLLVHRKPVTIEGVGKVEPIELNEILNNIKKINDKLPEALKLLIGNEVAILVQHKEFLQSARQSIVNANSARARLPDKPVKKLLSAKTIEINEILNRIDEAVKRLEQLEIVLNRTIGVLDKILTEQNGYVKLEIGVTDPDHKEASYGGLTELLDIIEKRFDQFANVAQDILDEADKIRDSFARKEKRIYDFITKMVERIKQESDKIVEINKTIKLDELNKLTDAAIKIASLVQQLNLFKERNNNRITANQLKSVIKLVEQLKKDLPQVTLQEFKEQLEGFIIVHENGEFKIIEVNGDNLTLDGINDSLTFEQLKEIDKILSKLAKDNALNLIKLIIQRTKADSNRFADRQYKPQYEEGTEDYKRMYTDEGKTPEQIPYAPLKDLIAEYVFKVIYDDKLDETEKSRKNRVLLNNFLLKEALEPNRTPEHHYKRNNFQIGCKIFEDYEEEFGNPSKGKEHNELISLLTAHKNANTELDDSKVQEIVQKVEAIKVSNTTAKLADFKELLVGLIIVHDGAKYRISDISDDDMQLTPI